MEYLRKNIKRIDKTLLIVTIILLVFGILAVSSASWYWAIKYNNPGFYYAKKHITAVLVGIVMLLIGINMPRKFLKNISFLMFVIAISSMVYLYIATKLDWVDKEYGQARSIIIPIIRLRFQPADLIKVFSVVYFASFLEKFRKQINDNEVFVMILFIFIVSAGIVVVKDFSTALVIGSSLFAMFFVAGMDRREFIITTFLGIIGIIVVLVFVKYRIERLTKFGQQASENRQQINGIYAIAMGSIGGVGLFHSRSKFGSIFAPHSDYIFAIIAEEMGLIGSVALIILLFIVIYRGYSIAYKAKNYFDKFMAVGLTTFIAIQTIFNLGVATGLFPVTGITLPLISYGGTSIIIILGSIGLLLGVSRRIR